MVFYGQQPASVFLTDSRIEHSARDSSGPTRARGTVRWWTHPGCVGGGGGYGGDGGHAGGGLGGSSLAIAYVGGQAPSHVGDTLNFGSFGDGGVGSDSRLSSSRGHGQEGRRPLH